MSISMEALFEELNYELTEKDFENTKKFNELGYYVIPRSELVHRYLDDYKQIIDDLISKESWRGGWEGKEEYMKYGKKFQEGALRLGNLFNKNNLFLKLLFEENLLKIISNIMENNFKIGGLDMREPIQGKGLQDFHMDWIPRKNENDKVQNIIAMIYLDDSNKNNGALRIVPKSHKILGWINDNLIDLTQHPDEITVEVKKGSIILFDGNLWHSGTKNVNGARRRVLYIDFRSKEIPQLLNQRIYLDEYTQSKLSNNEKFILGISDDDEIFEERVHTAGNVFRKQFPKRIHNKQSE